MTIPKDLTPAQIASLRLDADAFVKTPLCAALRAFVTRERDRILADLVDPKLPGDRLKYVQGELAQANRGIMLVELFLDALSTAQQRRQRQDERTES